MATILDRIVESKRREIDAARARVPEQALERQLSHAPPGRDFLGALKCGAGIQIIAEVKRASPSAGAIRAEVDVAQFAREYERNGAACVSVLTDEPFFHGSLEDLVGVRQVVGVPVLRKDFILDHYQVLEARVAGADAILLIAEILDDGALGDLLAQARAYGMEALVELYEPFNLERVLACGATLVGINNRNLHTFETSLEHTLALAPRVPSRCVLISESGIRTRADVERVAAVGAKAVLVGETLMRCPNVGRKLRELLGREDLAEG